MKKYCNTKFYNNFLPIFLFFTIMLTIALAVSLKSDILLILGVCGCVFFKWMYIRLEQLSLQQRKDYGVTGYMGDLTNATEEDIAKIKKRMI